jgi:transaldolase
MIKIPGTEEGLPAIETAISEGINVNVTLLFSVEAYEKVCEAYIRGSERRDGEYAHSVASFFVSRVDTEVDKRLAELGREDLRGTAAVANARAAYMRFKDIFLGERFASLREAGCPVQRPLWASTGVKDPHYPETKYVDSLVAPHTVNTMPAPTLLACEEQLEVTGPTADQDPSAELAALADAGIDMRDVTEKLLRPLCQFLFDFVVAIGAFAVKELNFGHRRLNNFGLDDSPPRLQLRIRQFVKTHVVKIVCYPSLYRFHINPSSSQTRIITGSNGRQTASQVVPLFYWPVKV